MTDSTRTVSRFHTVVTRRVLGALAALALAGGIAAGPVAEEPAEAATRSSSSVKATAASATGFVAALDDADVEALFDGVPNVPGTGLRLGDLTIDQRAAAYALLRSLLSAEAWEHLAELIAADAELDAAAGGGSAWSTDDYRIALFGEPAGDYVLQFSTADVVLSAIRQGDVVEVRPDVVA
jgi:hypothetical protein